MKENARINMISVSEPIDGSRPDKFELETMGSFYEKNGKFYIVYEETELTGFKGTTTTVKVAPDGVLLLRHGGVESRMEFAINQKRLCNYNTPYGAIPVATELYEFKSNFNERGGELEIRYALDFNNEKFAVNTLKISVGTKG